MKRWSAVFVLSFLSVSVWGQDQPPKLLLGAVHCLVAKEFLPNSAMHDASWGYWVDTSSYPGERVLYAVEYARGNRPKGRVFTVFLNDEGRRQVFNIQNNAKFVRAKDDFEGVRFTEDPLWGIWTQEHIIAAIKRIEQQPTFIVILKDAQASQAATFCESYADRR